jgi:hypothetical protein
MSMSSVSIILGILGFEGIVLEVEASLGHIIEVGFIRSLIIVGLL